MIATTAGQVTVSPFKIQTFTEVRIKKNINEHSELYVRGTLKYGETDENVIATKETTQIKVETTGEDSEILFSGITKTVEVRQEGESYEIEIYAVSNSFQLDIERKSRSFQDENMTYKSLVKSITREYGGDVIDTVSEGRATGKFIMQYNETDYEFLKRLGSKFNAGIVVGDTFDTPKYYFGIPQKIAQENLAEYKYTARKNLLSYMKSSKNSNPELMDLDSFEYEIETERFFNIGNSLVYKDINLYINSVDIKISHDVISNRYTLKTKRGLSQDEIFNEKINGVSLQGKVIAVQKDQIKVHLSIDGSQQIGKAWWFTYTSNYTAEGNSGWYAMPELNDTVYIYFPTNKEEEGIGFNSIRTQGKITDKTNDPSTKYFRTADGKELKFNQGEIVITARDNTIYIRLNEKSGIDIVSNLEINVSSNSDININAGKKIEIKAKEEISLICQSSNIKMDGEIKLEGKEVRNN